MFLYLFIWPKQSLMHNFRVRKNTKLHCNIVYNQIILLWFSKSKSHNSISFDLLVTEDSQYWHSHSANLTTCFCLKADCINPLEQTIFPPPLRLAGCWHEFPLQQEIVFTMWATVFNPLVLNTGTLARPAMLEKCLLTFLSLRIVFLLDCTSRMTCSHIVPAGGQETSSGKCEMGGA